VPEDGPYSSHVNNLTWGDIGSTVRFNWRMRSGVHAVVTGELRQIYYTAADIILNLSSGADTDGGELSEFVLEPGTPITVNPEGDL
jgi:hypothetical protein